jgi:hypothetical protein
MPISYGTATLEASILPITIHEDGSSTVSVRSGYVDAGGFHQINEQRFVISATDTQALLNEVPTAGLTRGADLTAAIYNYLVTANLVPSGTIS